MPAPPLHPVFLTADWRWLVMLNYEVDPAVLAPLVPPGTTIDLWQRRALVSLVGFRFLRTRVLGVPVPLHRDFDEVNLRFYVVRDTTDGERRRGVVFIRELVPRAAVTLLARLAYNEPYRTLPMRSVAPRAPTDAPGRLEYAWRVRGRWHHLAATAAGPPHPPPPDGEAAFVTEHYWGYSRQRDGSTVEYRVAHPPWRVWRAEQVEQTADVRALYGAAFLPALERPPVSAFIADGSAVSLHAPRRLGPPRDPATA